MEFSYGKFEIGTISNDFRISTNWGFRIQVSLTDVENPKNPGIQPNHELYHATVKKVLEMLREQFFQILK